MTPALPPHLSALYRASKKDILARLADFARVERSDWFYELCFCLCTPQSKAAHAMIVQQKLQLMGFKEHGGEITFILGDRSHYIRFHNTKAKRIHAVRENWGMIEAALASGVTSLELREELVQMVDGFGHKEASHFLRNIGHRNLAIIDRHLLRCLVDCHVLDSVPTVGTATAYRRIEELYRQYCQDIQIDMDEVDLLFWSAIAGEVLK